MKDKTALNWIYKKSKGQRLSMFFLILLNVLFSLSSVAFAFAVKMIIDGATGGDKDKLISGSIFIGVTVILQFVLRVSANGLADRIKAKLEMSYKTEIFNGVIRKKYDKIGAYHSGEVMNRLTSDVGVVSDGVASILPTVCSSVARLLFAVIALIMIDYVFAIAFTVAGLLVFGVISLLRGKLKSLHKKSQETEGKTRSFMQECIENLLAVKVFTVFDKVEEKSEKLQQENFSVKMKRKNYAVVGHATYNFIFSAGYVFALIFGAVKLLNGIVGFGYGDLSAILQLVNNVQVPFASLSGVMPKYYAMLSSAERLIEIENLEEEKIDASFNAIETYKTLKGISFKGVTFAYDRDLVLNGADFYANKGEIISIKGTSGIGKSTLIKLMLGVYDLSGGEIVLDTLGGEISLNSQTRKMFSYVPQGNLIFSGSILDNVTFATREYSETQLKECIKASCAEFIFDLPNGLDTIVGENGLGLSEGQVQRIAIARALLAQAPILLLDEATSALDEETEKRLLVNLKELNQTTFIISHRKSAFSVSDKIIQIKNKKIVQE